MNTQQTRTKCEIWTRVMGYHRPVSQYNHGKKSEFYSRVYFREILDENQKFIEQYAQERSKNRLMLFTTTSCPKCPSTKAWLAQNEVCYELIDNNSDGFLEIAQKYNIQSVPTLLSLDHESNELWRASDLSEMTEKLMAEKVAC